MGDLVRGAFDKGASQPGKLPETPEEVFDILRGELAACLVIGFHKDDAQLVIGSSTCDFQHDLALLALAQSHLAWRYAAHIKALPALAEALTEMQKNKADVLPLKSDA